MTLRQALLFGQKILASHDCHDSDPPREAELLLGRATGLNVETILARPETKLSAVQARLFKSYLRRRLRHEPAAYIVGTAWFRGLEFAVTPATLIPRPATETIVETALAVGERHPDAAVFDVGTGSGCIAVTLARSLPKTEIVATDASGAALKTARKNAVLHGVGKRIAFHQADLLSNIKGTDINTGRATLIVANLPYLPTGLITGLAPEVRDHEPATALDGGADGLDHYRRLFDQTAALLAYSDVHLVLELLPEQYRPLVALAKKKLPDIQAGKIVGMSGVCVGADLRSACAPGSR